MLNAARWNPFVRPQPAPVRAVRFAGKKDAPSPSAAPKPETTALFPFSADPITIGHLYVIQTAARLFNRLLVAIAVNPDKKHTFTEQERLDTVKALTRDLPNVEVLSVKNQLLATFSKQRDVSAIIRGLRGVNDLDYEKDMAHVNRLQAPDIPTIFLPAPREIEHVSSSLVRGLALSGPRGWRELVAPMVPELVLQQLKVKALQSHWFSLCENLGIAPNVAGPRFETLIKNYTNPDLAYHNVDHLIDCLEHLDAYLDAPDTLKPAQPELVALALWFHDLEDERQSPEAVAKSAHAAADFLKNSNKPEYASPEARAFVAGLVNVTDYKQKPVAETLERKLIQDIDIAVLGQARPRYKRYAQAIRKEYAAYDDAAYRVGRTQVLEGMLQRQPLYQLPWFQAQFEAQARRNLRHEINSLLKSAEKQGQ